MLSGFREGQVWQLAGERYVLLEAEQHKFFSAAVLLVAETECLEEAEHLWFWPDRLRREGILLEDSDGPPLEPKPALRFVEWSTRLSGFRPGEVG